MKSPLFSALWSKLKPSLIKVSLQKHLLWFWEASFSLSQIRFRMTCFHLKFLMFCWGKKGNRYTINEVWCSLAKSRKHQVFYQFWHGLGVLQGSAQKLSWLAVSSHVVPKWPLIGCYSPNQASSCIWITLNIVLSHIPLWCQISSPLFFICFSICLQITPSSFANKYILLVIILRSTI